MSEVSGRPLVLPLHHVVLPPNMPAGLDWAMVGLWCVTLRRTPRPLSEPVLVRRHECGQHWEIIDGRHRFVAGYAAGRTHIDAVEVA
jgi:hypothetical protein